MTKQKRRLWKKVLLIILILLIIGAAAVFGINAYVIHSTKAQVVARVDSNDNAISQEAIKQLKKQKADCILVLGALVRADGSPSYMLQDRLDTAIKLYKEGVAPKLLLSGDHGQIRYDEVNTMKKYTIKAGVPKEAIFLDHAGFSTYDSIYRASAVFQVKNMVIVTQGYHQYRALYGCKYMGIKAVGVAADQTTYRGQRMRDIREIAARDKDVVKWMAKPDPTYLGDVIPISGSGIKSQD